MILTSDVLAAAQYAAIMHHGQMRTGVAREPSFASSSEQPYIVHPLEVARQISKHGYAHGNSALMQAAILHDVIEDTPATYEDIESRFGKKVADIVLEVSDDPALSKKEQREYLFAHAHEKSWNARILKLADGIANMNDTNTRSPADWSRSLKLAYIKTCTKVAAVLCKGGGIPDTPGSIYDTFLRSAEAAKLRLAKERK